MTTAASIWRQLALDSAQPTPLYLQLAGKLADAIQAGVWQANQALPAERALCDQLGISRVTARKAIDILLARGLISKRHGSGNYITSKLEQPLSRLNSFSQDLQARGFKPGSVWLSRTTAMANQEEIMRLGLSPGTAVVRLKRLRTADDTVMAVEFTTIAKRHVPKPEAVSGSWYAFLEAQGMKVVRAIQHIQATNTSEDMAQLLGVKSGAAVLLLTRISYLASGLPIEVTQSYCRSDYYDLVIELHA